MDSPGNITEGDQSSINVFRQTFPYFVPIRYLEAVESNKRAAFSPEMLTSVHPYMGNWIMFCDFLETGNRPPVQTFVEEPATTGATDFFQLIREEIPESAPVAEPLPVVEEEPQPAVFEWASLPVEEPITEQQSEPYIPQIENDGEDENEITEEIATKQEVPEPEPVVAVSDAFLQLIREEGLENSNDIVQERTVESIYVAPVEIAPQPVFEPQYEPVVNYSDPKQNEPAITENKTWEEPATAPLQNIVEPVITTESKVGSEVVEEITDNTEDQNPLIFPIYTQDYFLQQGEKIPDELPDEINDLIDNTDIDDEDKSLMVVMSFTEWLLHLRNRKKKRKTRKR